MYFINYSQFNSNLPTDAGGGRRRASTTECRLQNRRITQQSLCRKTVILAITWKISSNHVIILLVNG